MPSPAPVSAMSAVAARKARQQQAQAARTEVIVEITNEPPSKRPRRSLEAQKVTQSSEESKGPRTRSSTKQEDSLPALRAGRQKKSLKSNQLESGSEEVVEETADSDQEEIEQDQVQDEEEMAEDEAASVIGDADGYESPADTPAELQNFPLSKVRLNKSNIVYADDDTMCVRIKEKTVWQTLSASSFNGAYSALELGVVGTV